MWATAAAMVTTIAITIVMAMATYGFSYSKQVVLYTAFLVVVKSIFLNILDSAEAILCHFKLSQCT